MRLASGGRVANIKTSGFVDYFQRADGPVGNGWTDRATAAPTKFSASNIASGKLNCTPSVPDSWGTHGYWLVSHHLLTRPLGYSDNFSITVRYECSQSLQYLSQVNPCAWVDMSATNMERGVMPVWDVANGFWYAQNVFETTSIGDTFDPTYYGLIGGGGSALPQPTTGSGVVHDFTLRARSGSFQAYFDGVPRWASSKTIPAWAVGRDSFGLHVVGISPVVGVDVPVVGISASVTPTRLLSFSAQPFTGTL